MHIRRREGVNYEGFYMLIYWLRLFGRAVAYEYCHFEHVTNDARTHFQLYSIAALENTGEGSKLGLFYGFSPDCLSATMQDATQLFRTRYNSVDWMLRSSMTQVVTHILQLNSAMLHTFF